MKLRWLGVVVMMGALVGCGGRPATQTVAVATDAAARARAATNLGRVSAGAAGSTAAVEALAAATTDPDESVRQAAIKSLSEIGTADARQALLDVVRGRQYTRAAYTQYANLRQRHPDQPEVLLGLAKAQLDLREYQGAEENLTATWRIVQNMNEQESGQYLMQLQSSMQNLRANYIMAGNQEGADRMQTALEPVEKAAQEAMAHAGQGGGMWGGMGGMGGIGGMGGLPIQMQ